MTTYTDIKKHAAQLVTEGVSRFQLAELMQQAEEGKGGLAKLTRFERGQLTDAYERARKCKAQEKHGI